MYPLALFVLATATATAAPPLDFRGHDFESSSCSENSGLTFFQHEGEGVEKLSIYTEVQPKLTIGPVPLIELIYTCWDDKLMMVTFTFDHSNGDVLLSILTDHWGEPRQDNQFMDDYTWMGAVFGRLEYTSHGSGSATILHGALTQRWQSARERDAASSASGDL